MTKREDMERLDAKDVDVHSIYGDHIDLRNELGVMVPTGTEDHLKQAYKTHSKELVMLLNECDVDGNVRVLNLFQRFVQTASIRQSIVESEVGSILLGKLVEVSKTDEVVLFRAGMDLICTWIEEYPVSAEYFMAEEVHKRVLAKLSTEIYDEESIYMVTRYLLACMRSNRSYANQQLVQPMVSLLRWNPTDRDMRNKVRAMAFDGIESASNQNTMIEEILGCGFLTSISDELSPGEYEICRRIIGNCLTGDDAQTQMIIDSGYVDRFFNLRDNNSKIAGESAWAISNIAAGTTKQIQYLLDRGTLQFIFDNFRTFDYTVQKELMWIPGNMLTNATASQVEQILESGVLGVISDWCITLNDDVADRVINDTIRRLLSDVIEKRISVSDKHLKFFTDQIKYTDRFPNLVELVRLNRAV